MILQRTPTDQPRIGVYVCHCGTNIASTVDVEQVREFAEALPNVLVARTYRFMCSDPGQALLREDIAAHQLNRVVVASCSPLLHEQTFRRTCAAAGLNPFQCQLANIREQVSWVTTDDARATAKAKSLLAGAVRRVAQHTPLEKRRVSVRPEVMVVGAGIAGIHAALCLADAGRKVYLVEREPTIGGHMAKFDKTFPTLDCAACILTPKMSAVKDHPNIVLMTYSEVAEVNGYVGNFNVKVRRKPPYVDPNKCTACGDCAEICPVTVSSEFELDLAERKAIYRSFPQAVPNTFVIDKKGRAPCRETCPASVHAQGYIALIRAKRYAEAFELLARDLPVPAACGRACYHPCEDGCTRGELDEPIAIKHLKRFVTEWAIKNTNLHDVQPLPVIHDEPVAVIGSGPAGLACANELARRGYKVTVFEADQKAGGMLRYGIPSYRLPEPVIDWDIERLRRLGIGIRVDSRVESIESLQQQGYRAVFIATGIGESMTLGIDGEDLPGVKGVLEFLKAVKTGRIRKVRGTVAVIGGGDSAMDAALTALRLGAERVMVVYRRSKVEMPVHAWELEEAEQEGVGFEFLTDPVEIRGDGRVRELVCVRTRLGDRDRSGRRRPVRIKGSQFTIPVNLVIPAIGQVTSAKLAEGLQTDWRGVIECDSVTLETGVDGVFAGGDIATGPATIVDAFGAGTRAAESIDRSLRGADLRADREVRPTVAPPPDLANTPPAPRVNERVLPPDEAVKSFREVTQTFTEAEALQEAERCLQCGVCAECLECERICQADAIRHDQIEKIEELEVGAIILATGFQTFDPKRLPQYGYGKYPDVYTSLEVERLVNASGPTGGEIRLQNGHKPRNIGIIHCVGSRDRKTNPYCSRVCCMYSLKLAHLVHERTEAEVFNFYIDMRTPGKGYEEFYDRILNEGVQMVRGRVAEVTDWAMTDNEKGKLIIRVEDTLVGMARRIPVDMVILAVGLEPQADVADVRRCFGISCSTEGWFLERHPKLAPVATFADGIWVAGACQGPKDIPDTVAQAGAAGLEALALLDAGFVEIEPITAWVDEQACSGCKTCIPLCPFNAITRDEEKGVAMINDALCKGCGTCVAACPSGAAQQMQFTDEQIYQEIEGVLT